MTKAIIMHYEPSDDSYVYDVERYFESEDYAYNFCKCFTNSSLYFVDIILLDPLDDVSYAKYISENDEYVCLIECELHFHAL